MCRATFEGGRRCPSHTNPVLIAAYNAKRRERYAARKLQPETTHAGKPVTPAASDATFNHPLFKTKNQYKVGKSSSELEALNLTQEKATGKLVTMGYLSGTVTHGVINYNNITPESYKEFGFEDPKQSYLKATEELDISKMKNLSKLELEGLKSEEVKGLRYFTSSAYEWLNEALYTQKIKPTVTNDHNVFDTKDEWHLDVLERDENALHQVCNAIDSAMDKAPKKQRVVYRGVSKFSAIFGEEDSFANPYDDNERAGALEKWVSTNLKLGQEIKFDGYQSSTPNKKTAINYANNQGLMYEILTSEGINVTDVSHFDYEREVLLPRDARYMVVGVHKNVEDKFGRKYQVVQLVAINEKGAVLDGTNASPLAGLPKN